jgi:hypothetical protein
MVKVGQNDIFAGLGARRATARRIERVQAPDTWRSGWLESAVAIVISIAGLGTSWSSYQAALWNSRQAIHFGAAGAYRTEGSGVALEAEMSRAIDVGLFSAWMDAKASGNDALAASYERRFTPEMQPAFAEWLSQQPLTNLRAAQSPFVLGSYRQPALAKAKELGRQAEGAFEDGMKANTYSNAYTRSAVILALSMFLGGVGQVFRRRGVRILLAVCAALACAYGVTRIFGLPGLGAP